MSSERMSLMHSLAEDVRYTPNSEENPQELTTKQEREAYKELNETAFIRKFPARETRYMDEPIHGQNIALISFIPAKGAVPNNKGIFGFAKVRGCFDSLEQSDKRAEQLIKKDSYHKILHARVGFPFPLTVSSKYSAETREVDIRKDMEESISLDVKKKREDEEKTIQEIHDKEKALLAEVKREHTDPEFVQDEYITLRVKKAQLTWAYLETEKKMAQMKENIVKTREELEKLDETNPTLKEKYMQKYMEARNQAGLNNDLSQQENNFIKFMVEDAELGF